MKTRITIHSGIYTIGGVVMELAYGNDRIIMEIGSAYHPETNVYDGLVEHRNKSWLKDALNLKQAPKVAGLYSEKDLLDYPLLSSESCTKNTAVFVSHLHLDHMACMAMVCPTIPVYLSDQAKTIEYALEDLGQGAIGYHHREYFPLNHLEVIKVGEIEVTPYFNNFNSHQHMSFYVETPDLKLHYTGDLIMHGQYPQRVLEEMEFVKAKNIDVLVADTTGFIDSVMDMMYENYDDEVIASPDLPKDMLDEAMLMAALQEDLAQVKGLCIVNFYVREMDDVTSFTEMAKACGRKLVLEPETAYIAHKFFNSKPLIYIPDYSKYQSDAEWLKIILANSTVVTKEEIHQNPNQFLLQNTYKNILELFDLPNKDAGYLHFGGEPLGDYDPAWYNLLRVLDLTNFKLVGTNEKRYFSHAYPQQAKYYVDQVDASILIPTHSFNPERLKASPGKVQFIPEEGATYELSDDKKTLVKI